MLKGMPDDIMAFLHARFSAGAEAVMMDEAVPGLGEVGALSTGLWIHNKDSPQAIGLDAYDVFEAINCLFENRFEDIPAAEPTQSHGSIGEVAARLTGSDG